MIKDHLAKRIAARFDISLTLAGLIVQAILDDLVSGLVLEGKIELRRFGSFRVRRQGPRVITLPSGKKIKRPAQKIVTFTPSPTVKKALNPPPISGSRGMKARKFTRLVESIKQAGKIHRGEMAPSRRFQVPGKKNTSKDKTSPAKRKTPGAPRKA